MRNLFATAAAVLVALIATPNTAEAGFHISIGTGYTYVSSHARCGCPIYTKRVIRGYDRYRRPVYHYVRQPFQCRGGHVRNHVQFRHHGFVDRRYHDGRSHYRGHSRHDRGHHRGHRDHRGHRGHRDHRGRR